MRKRGVYLIVAVLVVAGVLVAVFGREREPEYGGKRLSEWVVIYSIPPRMNLSREPEVAADAIRRMGTNAIPYLLKWIRYEPPEWKTKLHGFVNSALYKMDSNWEFTDRKERRAAGAVAAFQALGVEADGSIPELVRIFNDPKGMRSMARAIKALQYLGKNALPPLLTALTNQRHSVRDLAVESIGGLGTNALPAVPALLQLLNETNDSWATTEATDALRRIDPQALEKATTQ